MNVSIVMPVYNDSSHIQSVLQSFLDSWNSSIVELIIIDDGSTDNTQEIVNEYFSSEKRIRVFSQDNSGPAVARNRGTEYAKGDVILFTQGDIYATPQMLRLHADFHAQHSELNKAMIGYITWYEGLNVTPFMRWLEHGGPQFDFDRLVDGDHTDFLSFYTPNVSLKKQFILDLGGFDESLKGPAGLTVFEDTEFGWRAQKAGMDLIYSEKAVAFHDHYKSIESVFKRRELEGQYLYLLHEKDPSFSFHDTKEKMSDQFRKLKSSMIPDWIRVPITQFLFNKYTARPFVYLAKYFEKRKYVPIIFKIACGYYFNKGISASKHE